MSFLGCANSADDADGNNGTGVPDPVTSTAATVPPAQAGGTIPTKGGSSTASKPTSAASDRQGGDDAAHRDPTHDVLMELCGALAKQSAALVQLCERRKDGDTDTGAAVVKHLQQVQLLERYPYRASNELATDDREGYASKGEATVRSEAKTAMLALAKAGQLWPADVISSTLALYGTDIDRLWWNFHTVVKEPSARLVAYNWWVADKHGEPWKRQHGHLIQGLTLPLFPWPDVGDGWYTTSNQQILAAHESAVAAGGAPTNTASGKRHVPAAAAKFFKSINGGGIAGGYVPFPVVADATAPHGFAVDMQPVHDGLSYTQAVTAQMQGEAVRRDKQVDDMKRTEANLTKQVANLTKQVAELRARPATFSAPVSAAPAAAQQWSGRGGQRGRGGRAPRGGEASDVSEQTAPPAPPLGFSNVA